MTELELHGWLAIVLGIHVPVRPVLSGHSSPFDYLCHAYFEDRTPRDAVVWANRGGGKTFYAAVATALDLLFKPSIHVMILGGSLEQSRRMLAHLQELFGAAAMEDLLAKRMTQRRIELVNGSAVEVLAQSERSVRGARPQKLRCDEVDLFDRGVWRAAQLVVRSKRCGCVDVVGAVEAISTWHDPHGLMGEIVGECAERDGGGETRRLFRWGTVDVLERCAPASDGGRDCEGCVLWDECGGLARRGRGHISVDDAAGMKLRVDEATWRSEMLCERPSRRSAVFPEFDRGVHVGVFEPGAREGSLWIGGIDFGFRSPTVILFACIGEDGVLRVVDERVASEVTLDRHIQAMRGTRWPTPAWFGVDPAGNARSDQTGLSPVTVLRRAGFIVRSRRVGLEDGLRAVRTRIAPAAGEVGLLVHARCTNLIESLERYHYPARGPGDAWPAKDGWDHACDALRYLVINLDGGFRSRLGRYGG